MSASQMDERTLKCRTSLRIIRKAKRKVSGKKISTDVDVHPQNLFRARVHEHLGSDVCKPARNI